MNRTLTILADGVPVTGYARAKLIGTERLGLYPSLFMLDLWNLSEDDYLLLSRCKVVTVMHRKSMLVSGSMSDVFRDRRSGTFLPGAAARSPLETVHWTVSRALRTPRGRLDGSMITHVAISPGLNLWEASVSLSVEAGVTVSETVRRLLQASGTGIQLLSFPDVDLVMSRGQAFFGRAAECIEEVLGKVGASCCLVPSGLCVIPKNGLPIIMVLTEEDLTDVPSFNCGGDMVLRTEPAGWTLGKGIKVICGRTVTKGLITERMLNLDTGEGPWRVELVVRTCR